MTDNKDLKYTQTFKKEPTYKTYEQFVLEEQSEQDQKVADSYAQEIEAYSDISSPKGYGPCKNSLCGCSCSSYSCVCGGVRIQVKDTGASLSVSGRAKNTNSPFGKAGGQVSGSAFGYKDDDGELKIGSGTIGGEISSRSVKCKVSADLYNVKHDGIQARVGISATRVYRLKMGLRLKHLVLDLVSTKIKWGLALLFLNSNLIIGSKASVANLNLGRLIQRNSWP